jgi:Raf kinase inhibitor-like YbhB/YbcL family protein
MRQGLIFIMMIMMGLLPLSAFAQTTTTASSTPFVLTSPSFSSSQAIPKTYTCDDKNISPELTWTGIPENTKSFALIVSDPDAPGGIHYHWVIYNIPPTINSLDEGTATPPGTQGKNSSGDMKYNGLCPPKGSTHSYIFTLYALDSLLNLPNGADAETVMKAAQPHVLGTTQLTSSFGH